jgi:hypothetical protein
MLIFPPTAFTYQVCPIKVKVHPRTDHEVPVGEQRYISTLSLTSALDGVGGQRHSPAALPGTHCTGGLVGPWAGLDGY